MNPSLPKQCTSSPNRNTYLAFIKDVFQVVVLIQLFLIELVLLSDTYYCYH